jgi:hypothetical protein
MGDIGNDSLRERFARMLCESDAEDWRIYLGKADLILEVLLDPTPCMVDAAVAAGRRHGLKFAKSERNHDVVREMWQAAVEAERAIGKNFPDPTGAP